MLRQSEQHEKEEKEEEKVAMEVEEEEKEEEKEEEEEVVVDTLVRIARELYFNGDEFPENLQRCTHSRMDVGSVTNA